MIPPLPPEADLAAWVVDQGLVGESLASLVEQLAGKLATLGIPVQRIFIAMPVVSPDLKALSHIWRRGSGIIREEVTHDSHPDVFEKSPFWPMIQGGETFRRWRLDSGPSGYAILDGFRREGATDHLAHIVSFDPTDTLALSGAAISFTTDAPDGFTDLDVRRLTRLAPLLGLAACRFALSALVTEVLGAYIGHDAGRRVLRGEIRRGEGHRLTAALLFADLRSFTKAAETGGEEIVARLGLHLAAMAGPIEERGGEVLKFMGDGLLAAFPVGPEGPGPACATALAAACDALERNALVTGGRDGEGPLGLDVALHVGEVFYGNIGSARRLDFTVIGSAVNEASRIEGLCGLLDRPLLMSAPFAAACGRPVVSLGHHALRNVSAPREIFALA